MAGLAPLVGEVLGIERAAFDLTDDGVRHSVRIGDAIDFVVDPAKLVRVRAQTS